MLNSGNFCHILRVNQETKTTHYLLIYHHFSGRNVSPDTYELCHPAAPDPILCSVLHPRIPTPPSPTYITHSLSFLIISIYPSLVGASQQGSRCCAEGILGLWRQFGN